MATNLQVNANTQQAVGAFNQLAQAIAGARGQFQNMNVVLANGATAARTYGNAITQNITTGFGQLQSVAQGLFTALKFVGAGIELVFNSLLRELDKLQGFNAIMSVTTKSNEAVATSFDFVRKTADRLGVQFDAISNNYAKLTAAIPEGTNRLDIAQRAFLGVAMAARTMHSTNQDTQLMFYAVTQIASKGIVSMEELRRQLGEKLPGVIQIAAKALNTVPEELEKAIRKGIVISEKFLPIFGDALIRTFAESSEKAAQSVSAAMNRLTNVWVDFVKAVLDSGAGQSIVNVFDALREKLSDPYLIARFSDFIKILADRFADMVKNLTSEDIRNGFDTFSRAVQFLITLMEKLVSIFTWIINNGPKAGAIIGGLGGVAVGAAFGPVGAAVGGAVGAVGGAYAGKALSPSGEEMFARAMSDQKASQEKSRAVAEQQLIKDQAIIPLLQQFRNLNSLKDVENLLKPDRLNTRTMQQLAEILSGNKFKTDSDKLAALKDLNKTGIVLNPATAQLKDVLDPDKPTKPTAAERSLDATFWKANGFDGNFPTEKVNLDKLFKQGKLDVEAYDKAYTALLAKQPFMEAEIQKQKKAQESYNRVTEQMIDLALRYIDVKEEIATKLTDELQLAGMRSEDRVLEQQVTQDVNKLRDVGKTLTKDETDLLREKYRIILQIQQVTAAEDQLLNSTVDKYKNQIIQLQAMEKLMQDPSSGFAKQNAQDVLATSDPNMVGSMEWQDAQRRSLEEYYFWVEGLRRKDLVSEKTAQMMKARAQIEYDSTRLNQTRDFFGNLATLSRSGNSKIAAIGRAAAVAQATIDGYVAVQKALASAPPPWNYALAAAVGIAAAANVANILSSGKGFYGGGYTGDGARGQAAGVVHGQEFVVNASATAKNRAALEAMNRGMNPTQAQSSGGSAVTVIVNNNAPDTKTTQRERDTPNGKEIEVTIERVVAGNIRNGGKIASAVEAQYGLNRATGTVR